jgi:hypothetical protein
LHRPNDGFRRQAAINARSFRADGVKNGLILAAGLGVLSFVVTVVPWI